MKVESIIKYSLYMFLAGNGAFLVVVEPEFSFFWWAGAINLGFFGGHVLSELIESLAKFTVSVIEKED